jgi:altronate dehydratase
MNEEPNLIYLNNLSDGDETIKNKLLLILKEEFVQEIEIYKLNVINNNLISAAENVHKIRHKIGFLGMEKAYDLSNQYEHNLRNNSNELKNEFEIILEVINEFVLKIEFL